LLLDEPSGDLDGEAEYALAEGLKELSRTRTVLDYLIKPVLKLKHEAFRER
jgi:ABC-type sulfate/molybdate transport systems ATPase subunit